MEKYKLSTPQTYTDIAKSWINVAQRGESGTWIFSPLGGIHFIVEQFLADAKIQKKLLGDQYGRFQFVSVHIKEYTTKPFESILLQEIHEQWHETIATLEELYVYLDHKKVTLVILLQGLEWAIKSGKWELFDDLYLLSVKRSSVKIILLVSIDLTDPSISQGNFGRYSTLLQNVVIYPGKGYDEAKQYIAFLEKNWNVHPTEGQKKWIEDNCGPSFRFIKEIYRQLQLHPNLTPEEMDNLQSLKFKTRLLLDSFLEDQREVVLRVIHGDIIPERLYHPFHYLKSINWIVEKDGKLHLAVPYIEKYIKRGENDADNANTLSLTEKAVYNLFARNEGKTVSRDNIATIVWGKNYSGKYSDWAIDQMIHRLKKKIVRHYPNEKIMTVRGKGFSLIRS